MKRRDFFLFLSFAALFVLFAIFQNFSFPTKQLQQIGKKEFFKEQIQKFVPTYSFNDYIGEYIEAPYGYKEEINRKIASRNELIVFDQKKCLKDGVKTLPIYKDLKSLIDISNADSGPETPSHCVENPIEPQNNCHVEYSGEARKTGSVKVKANFLRQTASISVPGDIESKMMYVRDRKSINMQFKKNIDKDSGVKLELDSQEQSGSIKFDVRW